MEASKCSLQIPDDGLLLPLSGIQRGQIHALRVK